MTSAKNINHFSIDLGTISVGDTDDWLHTANYTSTWSINNIFEVTSDIEFNNSISKTLSNNFRGVFDGKIFRLSNFTTRAFGSITNDAYIINIIFYNFVVTTHPLVKRGGVPHGI